MLQELTTFNNLNELLTQFYLLKAVIEKHKE